MRRLLALGLLLNACHASPPAGAGPMLAKIVVTVPGTAADQSLNLRQSAYGDNLSPALGWTPVSGAKSYTVTMDDPDAPGSKPFVHWMIWNIPGDFTALPEGIITQAEPASVPGARQGRNDAGTPGYFGPRPPSGLHHYRIRLYALDTTLALSPDAGFDRLTQAMTGHILARGDHQALYAAPKP